MSEEKGLTRSSGKGEPWYRVWLTVYFRPSVPSYRELLSRCDARISQPMMWLVISTGINVGTPLLLYLLTNGRVVHPNLTAVFELGEMGWALYILISALSVVLAPAAFFIVVRFMDWLAHQMEGQGNFEELGLLTGAAYVPFIVMLTFLEGLLGPFRSLAFRALLSLFVSFLS